VLLRHPLRRFDEERLTLSDGTVLKVSRTYRAEVLKAVGTRSTA
jgi:hypothetical protein